MSDADRPASPESPARAPGPRCRCYRTTCDCTSCRPLDDLLFEVEGDTIHTRIGCFHRSLFETASPPAAEEMPLGLTPVSAARLAELWNEWSGMSPRVRGEAWRGEVMSLIEEVRIARAAAEETHGEADDLPLPLRKPYCPVCRWEPCQCPAPPPPSQTDEWLPCRCGEVRNLTPGTIHVTGGNKHHTHRDCWTDAATAAPSDPEETP